MITVRGEGVPLRAAQAFAARFTQLARERFEVDLTVDAAALLRRRPAAAVSSAACRAQVSHGGSARLLRAADGWWALNLARPSDVELMPALVEGSVDDPWQAVTTWSARRSAQQVVGRAVLLGLAAARLGETPVPTAPWRVGTSAPAERFTRPMVGGRVVNLGSLWAAPLAARLLGMLGFEIVHVESIARPDASRWGDPGLYRALRQGAQVRMIDFESERGQRELHALVASADVVIEASRPRALRALGVAPDDVLSDGRARTWLQLTGHGPTQPHRIGFGDDAAVAAGLVSRLGPDSPGFCGDAVADPLTGLLGAVAVATTHRDDRAAVLQMSLADAAAVALRVADRVTMAQHLDQADSPQHILERQGCPVRLEAHTRNGAR